MLQLHNKMTITVFTPTYNRAYIIGTLYESLKRQTCKEFEWLVVDDGSTDNTEELFREWSKETSFPVRYIKQQNGGKHRAINRGVKETKGELFFIVDSDDYLVDNAIERILHHFTSIKDDNSFCGVCGLKCHPDGTKVGGGDNFGIIDCTSLDFRYKYKMKGDMAEVLRTDILQQYPFPEMEGEKFCPEAVIFNRIAQRYKFRYFYENIYFCDYLPDGLTAKITRIRMQSPVSAMICYSDLAGFNVPLRQRIKAASNFWRFSLCSQEAFGSKLKKIGLQWLFALPIGYMIHLKDKKQI